MRRMAPMCAVAVLAMATNAMAAVEIAQYFGPASVGAPDITYGGRSNPTITALPGDTVYLPVWMEVFRGDSTAAFTAVRVWHFETSAIAGNGALQSDFIGGGANTSVGYAGCIQPGPGGGAGMANLPGSFNLTSVFGCNPPPGFDQGYRSDHAGIPATDPGSGSWLLGFISVQISPTAAIGGTLDVYMHTPRAGNKYITNGAAAQTSLAYGVDGGGNLEDVRLINGAPSGIMIGTLNNQVSASPDATITILPEPGTLGLLALGLLGIRRRRN